MKAVDISQFDDSVVLHFETEGQKINAYTLASILVSLADAAKAANAQLNPGYEVEIVVEALGPGSFRAKIRAFYKKNRNLLKYLSTFQDCNNQTCPIRIRLTSARRH
jgi:hypothetical protein